MKRLKIGKSQVDIKNHFLYIFIILAMFFWRSRSAKFDKKTKLHEKVSLTCFYHFCKTKNTLIKIRDFAISSKDLSNNRIASLPFNVSSAFPDTVLGKNKQSFSLFERILNIFDNYTKHVRVCFTVQLKHKNFSV